jgi:hypothetical protein
VGGKPSTSPVCTGVRYARGFSWQASWTTPWPYNNIVSINKVLIIKISRNVCPSLKGVGQLSCDMWHVYSISLITSLFFLENKNWKEAFKSMAWRGLLLHFPLFLCRKLGLKRSSWHHDSSFCFVFKRKK